MALCRSGMHVATRPTHAPDEVTGTCCVQVTDGGICGREAIGPAAPFDVCGRHAIELYRYLGNVIGGDGGTTTTPAYVNATQALSRDELAALPHHRDNLMNGWPAVVYYLAVAEHIKIGTTQELYARMRAYPPSMRLLAVEPGDYDVERGRHHQFKAHSVTREWFHPHPELMDHISQLAAAGLPRGPRFARASA